MKRNPIVSIILPYYNAEETLSRAAESMLNQSFPNFELLLVDNNSTDGSYTVAQNFAEKDCRVHNLSESRQGVDFAMNCGLKNAMGKYIARMDADDVSHRLRLEKQVEFLEKNPEYGLVGSSVRYVPHSSNTNGFRRFVNWVNSFSTFGEIKINRFIEIPIVNPTILFKRDLYERFGGCRHGDFPEDYEMQLRYLDAGVRMAKLPEPLLEWHDYSHRLTRTNERYTTEAFFNVKAEYFRKWSCQNNVLHPRVWVWGAGRKTRRRASLIESGGITIEGYIDVVKNKTTVKTTLHFTEVPPPGKMFIVAMVGSYGAREQIRQYLIKKRYTDGKDFVFLV
ncbi:MAG: glycosyltransferase family 2 protein [Mariniphaga sp.]